MSYCLLVQAADGSLRLLAEAPFASRNEALSALAAQADVGVVDSASEQVWLIDLDSVAPVVLVGRSSHIAPVSAGTGIEEPEPAISEESDRVVVQAEPVEPVELVEPAWAAAAGLVADEEQTAVVPVPVEVVTLVGESVIATEEPVVDVAGPAPVETLSEPVEELPGLPEPGAVFEPDALSTPVSPQPAPAFANEVVEIPVVAPSILDDLELPAPEPEPQPVEDSFSDLREALERSAAQMESEGVRVVAAPATSEASEEEGSASFEPEAPAADEPELEEPELELEEPELEEPEPEEPELELESPAAGLELELEVPAPEPASEPALEEPELEEPAPQQAEAAEIVSWPWAASLPEIEPTCDASELELEPAVEYAASTEADEPPVEPMSVTSGDDVDLAFVGAGEDYSALPAPQPLDLSNDGPLADMTATRATQLPAEAPFAVSAPPAEIVEVPAAEDAVMDVSATPADDGLVPQPSAFVNDVVAPTTVETPGYTPGAHSVADLSCGDCVWVDTCPNKDQRDPGSCGSFQWK